MNLIINKGRLGQAATVRVVGADRTPVVNFSLAVTVGYGANEKTEWRDCSWWGESAEKCVQWLTKGREVLVQAQPSVRSFQKRDGTTAAVMDLRVDRLEFCGSKDTPPEAQTGAVSDAALIAGRQGEVTTVMKPAPAQSAKAEEDVPF